VPTFGESRSCGRAVCWIASLVWVAAVGIVTAQIRDPVAAVHGTLKAFFPELVDDRHFVIVYRTAPANRTWTTDGFLQSFGLEVVESRDAFLRDNTSERIGKGLLDVSSDFDPDGSLRALHVIGTANHFLELLALRSVVEKNTNWSDDDVVRLLSDKGARYTPANRAAFVAQLPRMATLVEIFGAMPSIEEAVFMIRPLDSSGRPTVVLTWDVVFQCRVAGKQLRYDATFEPLEGKLLHLGRIND